MDTNDGTARDKRLHQVERAIFDLRRGVPVVVRGGDAAAGEAVVVYPVESIGERDIEAVLDNASEAPALTVTRHRMDAMGLTSVGDAASLPLNVDGGLDPVEIYRAAAGENGVAAGVLGPARSASAPEHAALSLMRRALLVPAAVTARLDEAHGHAVEQALDDGRLLEVDAELAERCFETGAGVLHRVSEAEVPLKASPDSRFVLFREPDGLREHVAVLIGDPARWPSEVPTRLHSACLTGDLFGSLRCDCGEQLQNAVAAIAELGGGVLLYLDQEGRGIGLANKLRAYELQDGGLDTVDADHVLGFGEDDRRYRVAVDMLASLSIRRVRLLTNNPHKMQALVDGGIEVASRSGLFGRVTRENRRYLEAKATRTGHLLDDVLSD